MIREALLVAAGGALGAVGRWAMSNAVQRAAGSGFPWGTLTVNVTGSLLLGIVLALALRDQVSPSMRLLVGTGALGAFTTFSTFSWETLALLRDGSYGAAAGNVMASVVVCLAACGLGVFATRTLSG